ncbi:DUF418 domain-containing protein [Jiangella sp. DSM 45060]|uniref:DUF418 domain-containing protein n=1 Tax=Jiangella sp. DSM 45060 TaxID=1798224 RepID=UPI00087D93B5|nr:DUF418 domain-containing protein [Jiangella sp. DSM 45060]SDT50443.1 Uncharacterized membrane protein YeiB [Jiangella sp. DSM 45060]
MATTAQARPAGPTATAERALGPDLARGFMLLFIALANSHYFLRGDVVRGGFPMDGSWLDSAVTWLVATFVDGRAFPMFGLLFGYGVARLVRRNEALGPRGVRRLLWRRSLVLIVVGFLHAMLLYVGDILAAYGVLLLLGAWTVRWRARWLVLLAAGFFALLLFPSADSLSISTDPPDASMLSPDLASMFSERIVVQPFVMLGGPIGFACPFLVGLLAGRARVLERPAEHRRLLTVTAVAGLTVAVLGAQPVALMLAGVTDVPSASTLELIGPLHDWSGVLGGFGYAALITLVAARLTGRTGRVTEAIRATGQRSMTCYLLQSVVWAAVFTPFLLDLSGTLTVAGTALLATATWAATVVVADQLRRRDRRGPFEVLVRRVTYGRR